MNNFISFQFLNLTNDIATYVNNESKLQVEGEMLHHSTLRPTMTMAELKAELSNIRIWRVDGVQSTTHKHLNKSDWNEATLVDIEDNGEVVEKRDWITNLVLAAIVLMLLFIAAHIAENTKPGNNFNHRVSISKESP